jgi:hypothetical protein
MPVGLKEQHTFTCMLAGLKEQHTFTCMLAGMKEQHTFTCMLAGLKEQHSQFEQGHILLTCTASIDGGLYL